MLIHEPVWRVEDDRQDEDEDENKAMSRHYIDGKPIQVQQS